MMASYSSEDPYRNYGLEHFCTKYGIPKLDLEKFERKFSLEIIKNEIQDNIVTWIKTDHGKLPFFEGIRDDTLIRENNGKIKVNFDIFNEIGYILSGHLERLTLKEREKIAKIPIVDIYERILFDAIRRNKKIKAKPFWPNGKKFALCLTHDVDEVRKTYQYFTRSIQHIGRLEFSRAFYHIKSFFTDKIYRRNPYWTFEKIMKLEKDLGVKSTFFFLQEDGKVDILRPETWKHYARRYKFSNLEIIKIINKLHHAGWEIGLHGSYYSYKDPEKLRKDKNELEEILNTKIHGIRQHHLNLEIPETWHHHEKIGLEYDTSLGFNNCLGFRWGTCFPFYPFDSSAKKPLSVLEVPLIIMDINLLKIKDANKEIYNIIDTIKKQSGLLTILWHHTVFNDDEYPGLSKKYEEIINLCKEKNAWITTANEINKWWRCRNGSNT